MTNEQVNIIQYLGGKQFTYAGGPKGNSPHINGDDWQNNPIDADDIDTTRNVGIICGYELVSVDIDENLSYWTGRLAGFDINETAKVFRANAPDKAKFLYRITDDGSKYKSCGKMPEFLGGNGKKFAHIYGINKKDGDCVIEWNGLDALDITPSQWNAMIEIYDQELLKTARKSTHNEESIEACLQAIAQAQDGARNNTMIEVMIHLNDKFGWYDRVQLFDAASTNGMPAKEINSLLDWKERCNKSFLEKKQNNEIVDIGDRIKVSNNTTGFATLVEDMGMELRYDIDDGMIQYKRDTHDWKPWDDTAIADLYCHSVDHFAVGKQPWRISERDTKMYVNQMAHANEVHSGVILWHTLKNEWDDIDRLDEYFGSIYDLGSDKTYANEVFAHCFAGMVRKYCLTGLAWSDNAMELSPWQREPIKGMMAWIGGQDLGKSTTARGLALDISMFTESFQLSGTVQEISESARGAAIAEAPEAYFGSKSNRALKADLFKIKDDYRQPYALSSTPVFRRFTVIITANEDGYKIIPHDPTGNTRYWPININLWSDDLDDHWANLKEKLDPYIVRQLWCEAVHNDHKYNPNNLHKYNDTRNQLATQHAGENEKFDDAVSNILTSNDIAKVRQQCNRKRTHPDTGKEVELFTKKELVYLAGLELEVSHVDLDKYGYKFDIALKRDGWQKYPKVVKLGGKSTNVWFHPTVTTPHSTSTDPAMDEEEYVDGLSNRGL